MLDNCPQCDYSLEGLPATHVCPECGWAYDKESQILRSRKRRIVLTIFPRTIGLAGFFVARPKADYVLFLLIMVGLAAIWFSVTWMIRRRRNFVILSSSGITLAYHDKTVRTIAWHEIGLMRHDIWFGGVKLIGHNDREVYTIPAKFLGSTKLNRKLIRDAEAWRKRAADSA